MNLYKYALEKKKKHFTGMHFETKCHCHILRHASARQVPFS